MALNQLRITKKNESSCQLLLRILSSHGWRGDVNVDINFPFLKMDWDSNTFWQGCHSSINFNEISIEQALEKAYSL